MRALVDDDSRTHTLLRRRGALLWSSHWFFFNRRLKRIILFVSVWAHSRAMSRWGDEDVYGSPGKLQTISGERFLGWEGAVGAGARAMGLSAAARWLPFVSCFIIQTNFCVAHSHFLAQRCCDSPSCLNTCFDSISMPTSLGISCRLHKTFFYTYGLNSYPAFVDRKSTAIVSDLGARVSN